MGGFVEGIAAHQASRAEAASLQAKGDIDRRTAELNARQAELQAKEVTGRGMSQAARFEAQGQAIEGSQRAMLAAMGQTGSEQAQLIQAQTRTITAADEAAIKVNAWRAAWGLESQAEQYRTQGVLAQNYARYAARQSLISGNIRLAAGIASGVTQGVMLGSALTPKGAPQGTAGTGEGALTYGNFRPRGGLA